MLVLVLLIFMVYLLSFRRHVFGDLKPYVCTSLDCPKADELFGSRREWFNHEVQLHWREWYCDACSKLFIQKTLFQEHIEKKHPELVTKGHLEAVISSYERATVNRIICPLCGNEFTVQTLEKHLGLHLQEVALFVLPDPGEGSSSESKSGKVDNSIGSSDDHSSRKSSFEFDPDGRQAVGDHPIVSPVTAEEIRCLMTDSELD